MASVELGDLHELLDPPYEGVGIGPDPLDVLDIGGTRLRHAPRAGRRAPE